MPTLDNLEKDQRFKPGIAASWQKFLQSYEGQTGLALLREQAAKYDMKLDSGMESAALTGAVGQGYREAEQFLLRLTVYNEPKKAADLGDRLVRA